MTIQREFNLFRFISLETIPCTNTNSYYCRCIVDIYIYIYNRILRSCKIDFCQLLLLIKFFEICTQEWCVPRPKPHRKFHIGITILKESPSTETDRIRDWKRPPWSTPQCSVTGNGEILLERVLSMCLLIFWGMPSWKDKLVCCSYPICSKIRTGVMSVERLPKYIPFIFAKYFVAISRE